MRAMAIETVLSLKASLVVGALLAFALYERVRPAAGGPLLVRFGRASRAAWHRLARNLGLFSINLALSPLLVVPITAWAEHWSVGLRPLWWGGWWGLGLDVVLLDLWIYWWHRANHELPMLWRFHQVHHLDQALDTSSALRFHFGQVLLSALARAVPIVLLDIPLGSVLIFEAVVLACAIFHHSDARLPAGLEGTLARIVITPSIHWVHHHAIRSDTDSNYGTLFSFWDRLFRSRSRTRRDPAMAIGVESSADRDLLGLLKAPFDP
jgi:sterol desaturase/sphingolipid hydroxylase (fatty acid hydroxylase superfamily)